MATKDNSPGLLSKVARFMRNPTVDWSDLDNQVSEPDSGYSKQALKAMIERKRQNDFVRRREFDQLRKLRNRDPAVPSADPADPNASFQNSVASNPDERASTLKKIDAIEAQMSRQWWKGRQDTAFVHEGSAAPALSESAPEKLETGFAATQAAEAYSPSDTADFAQTQMSPASANGHAMRTDDERSSRPTFSNSELFVNQLGDGEADSDLEEAAIRFANGDDAGVQTVLLEALERSPLNQDAANVWIATLFDFYRATGQQTRFEKCSLDFAQRFGYTAPPWFSIPKLLRTSTAVDATTIPSPLPTSPVWDSPAEFTIEALDRLNLALANAASPWHVNWQSLERIEARAASPLSQLFATWCNAPVKLQFDGTSRLLKTLRHYTPSGNRQLSQVWWRLRMDALRIIGLQDEFQLAALDYCVTYEVSPPTWQAAHCVCIQEDISGGDDALSAIRENTDGAPQAIAIAERSQALTIAMSLDSTMPPATVSLSGEITGEAAETLSMLDRARRTSERLAISCEQLIRVDFSAAGSLLNWAAQRQAEGYQVQFHDVHRLVAAFFNVIGINEHAKVVLRSN